MADHIAEQMREYLGDMKNIRGKAAETIFIEFLRRNNILREDLAHLHLKLIPIIKEAIDKGDAR